MERNELADHKLTPICLLYMTTRFSCMFIIKVTLFRLFYGSCLFVRGCYSNGKHKENFFFNFFGSLKKFPFCTILPTSFGVFFDINKFSCYSPCELGK